MLKSVRRRLLSRGVTIGTIGAVLALILVAALVPQRGITASETLMKWRQSHKGFLPLVDLAGLDHLYSTPYFIALVSMALLILVLSTLGQGERAFTQTFRSPPPEDAGIEVPAGEVERVLARHGYRRIGKSGTLRFVSQPWGYWGNFLLHLGITVTVAASLVIALTYQRSTLTLYEGVFHNPGDRWEEEEHGLLAPPLAFPYSVRLERLRGEFSRTGTVTRMTSELRLRDAGGRDSMHEVELNTIFEHHGVRIYQSVGFGDLFIVGFTGPDGASRTELLQLYLPDDLEASSYRDFTLPWLPHVLSSRYQADVDKQSMMSPNRLLVLRLMDNGRQFARLALLPGEEGMLGPYRVKLIGVGKWSNLAFVRIAGMPWVFFGFFVIVAGLILQYVTPPREIGAKPTGAGWIIRWRATRFAEFYAEEYAAIIKELQGENTSHPTEDFR